jgi:3-hydroxyacyl-CoA dehydrogenase/enoyl-CoA hydratase/3-hydroxybutyryl-CoA epimerase
MLEAATAYAEGIPGPVIDKAAVKFGMPMGPIELIDTVGLDVAAGVGRELAPFLGLQIRPRCRRWNRTSAARRTARASTPGRTASRRSRTWPATTRPRRMEDRLILPLLNEAVACLHEGVVADAGPAGCRRDLRHRLSPRSAAVRSSTSVRSVPMRSSSG